MPTALLSPAAEVHANAADAADRQALLAALEEHRGSVVGAAASLWVHPSTIHRRLAALGLTAWHRATYPRSGRQPGAEERKPRRIKGGRKIDKKKHRPPGQ